MDLVTNLKHARRVSVPLVSITTADESSTIKTVLKMINGKVADTPLVGWDVLSGCIPLNAAGKSVAASTGQGDDDLTIGNPTKLLEMAKCFPPSTIVFVSNADQYLKPQDTPGVLQGISNLRDVYKMDARMLILLSAAKLDFPEALRGHVTCFDDPLPNADQLKVIVEAMDEAATKSSPDRPRLDAATVKKAVDAVIGLAAFPAETAVAMALRSKGIDLDHLLQSKKKIIGGIPGLTVDEGRETFEDVGGLAQVKKLGTMVFSGPQPPAIVLRLEEIGKALAGAKGDTSGTRQDAVQVLLNSMEDYNWTGIVAYGPAGTGKSFYSKVLARTFGALSLTFDINAALGGIVGQSEKQIRAAMNTVHAIGGSNVFLVATSNELDTLPPELRRRFRFGIWYFDMPDDEEKASIWKLNRKRFNVPEDAQQPDDSLYSAANIRDVCESACRSGCSLLEAAEFILPAGLGGKEQIDKSRSQAEGRFLSASFPGVYQKPTYKVAAGRAITTDDE